MLEQTPDDIKYTTKKIVSYMIKQIENGSAVVWPGDHKYGLHRRTTTMVTIGNNYDHHNEFGPAIVSINEETKKINFKHYYLNGSKLPCGCLIQTLIEKRERGIDDKEKKV